MDPVDDSFAPNYSKLIKTPMCFAMMGQKVLTRQYSTWRLFVVGNWHLLPLISRFIFSSPGWHGS